jgi:hypothetical protein
MAAAESISRIVSIAKQMFAIFAKPLFKRPCMLYYTDNEQMFLRRFSMKILGLLLVLGIGIFLIWFFEEIFKDRSEEDYRGCEYETPRRTGRSGMPAVNTGIRTEYAGGREIRTVYGSSTGAREVRTVYGLRQEAAPGRAVYGTTAAAANRSRTDRRDMTRIPNTRDRRDITGQSCRKSA